MKQILIATHNSAKIKEIKIGLKPLKNKLELLTLSDLKIKDEPRETGNTFCDNALLKAHFYANLAKLPAIADDGGLIIPYLKNEPGVKSKLWLGYEVTDEKLIEYTLFRLKDAPLSQRNAYLETCLCFYNPSTGKAIFEHEKITGFIAGKPFEKWEKGFPFRALLVVDKFNKYYDALSYKEHQQINHRLIALKRLVKKIKYLI